MWLRDSLFNSPYHSNSMSVKDEKEWNSRANGLIAHFKAHDSVLVHFSIVSFNCYGICALNGKYWFSHKIVIWQHRQTNQILAWAQDYTFSHLLSLAMDFRALSKIHISVFFFFLFPLLCLSFHLSLFLCVGCTCSDISYIFVINRVKIVDPITLFSISELSLSLFDYQRPNFWSNIDEFFFLFPITLLDLQSSPAKIVGKFLLLALSLYLYNTFIFHLCTNIGVVDWSFAVFYSALHLLPTNTRI